MLLRDNTLRIVNSSRADEGHYVCLAVNTFGSAEMTAMLWVKGKQGPQGASFPAKLAPANHGLTAPNCGCLSPPPTPYPHPAGSEGTGDRTLCLVIREAAITSQIHHRTTPIAAACLRVATLRRIVQCSGDMLGSWGFSWWVSRQQPLQHDWSDTN